MRSVMSFLEEIAPWYRFYGSPDLDSLVSFSTEIGRLASISSSVDSKGSVVSTLFTTDEFVIHHEAELKYESLPSFRALFKTDGDTEMEIEESFKSEQLITASITFPNHTEYDLEISAEATGGKTGLVKVKFNNSVFTEQIEAGQLLMPSIISQIATEIKKLGGSLGISSSSQFLYKYISDIALEDLANIVLVRNP